jgi:hypothetical protein
MAMGEAAQYAAAPGMATIATGGGWIGSWSQGIGDPTVMGWVTVVAYGVAAWQCVVLGRGEVRDMPADERRVWWGLAAIMLLLGVNKQLDVQTAFTELGRIVARTQGWYGRRAHVQRRFIELVLAGAIGTIVVALIIVRKMPRATRLAIVGLTLLAAFVFIRATSFHKVDLILGARWLGMKANWLFELGGIGLILLGAHIRRAARADVTRLETRAPAQRG